MRVYRWLLCCLFFGFSVLPVFVQSSPEDRSLAPSPLPEPSTTTESSIPEHRQDFKPSEVKAIVDYVDRLWRGETSKAKMTMKVKTAHYERVMALEAWSLAQTHSLVILRQPIKDRGIATLKVHNQIWNYFPKINRVTKIPSSMMSGSWMGSHFTNDDLIKENTLSQDYDCTISISAKHDGEPFLALTALPKPNATVVWGKIIMHLEQRYWTPFYFGYYDENGALVRTMVLDEPRRLGNRIIPLRLTLTPVDKPGESTVVRYEDIMFDRPIDENFFSLKNLKGNL